MKKFTAVAGVLLLSSSVLAACTPNAAPKNNAGNNGTYDTTRGGRVLDTGNDNRAGVRGLGANNGQTRANAVNLHNDRTLESRVESIPGIRNATVLVAGNTAYVAIDQSRNLNGTNRADTAGTGTGTTGDLNNRYGGTYGTGTGAGTAGTGRAGTTGTTGGAGTRYNAVDTNNGNTGFTYGQGTTGPGTSSNITGTTNTGRTGTAGTGGTASMGGTTGGTTGGTIAGTNTTGPGSTYGTGTNANNAGGTAAGGIRRGVGSVIGLGGAAGNAVGNVGSAAGNAVGNVGSATGNAAGNVGRAAGNVAGNVGNVAGNTVGNVGRAAGNAAGNVGSAIGNAVGNVGSAVGNVVGNAGHAVGNAANRTANRVGGPGTTAGTNTGMSGVTQYGGTMSDRDIGVRNNVGGPAGTGSYTTPANPLNPTSPTTPLTPGTRTSGMTGTTYSGTPGTPGSAYVAPGRAGTYNTGANNTARGYYTNGTTAGNGAGVLSGVGNAGNTYMHNNATGNRAGTNATRNTTRGYVVYSDAGVSGDIKNRIATIIRQTDATISKVYVSANPNLMNRMDAYVRNTGTGHPLQGGNDLLDTVRRMFPASR